MKAKNRKKELLLAIASRDKVKLREALSKNLPEKWLTIEINHDLKQLKHLEKVVTEEEMKAILDEAKKNYQVKLVIMNRYRDKDQSLVDEWKMYEPEMILNFERIIVLEA